MSLSYLSLISFTVCSGILSNATDEVLFALSLSTFPLRFILLNLLLLLLLIVVLGAPRVGDGGDFGREGPSVRHRAAHLQLDIQGLHGDRHQFAVLAWSSLLIHGCALLSLLLVCLLHHRSDTLSLLLSHAQL